MNTPGPCFTSNKMILGFFLPYWMLYYTHYIDYTKHGLMVVFVKTVYRLVGNCRANRYLLPVAAVHLLRKTPNNALLHRSTKYQQPPPTQIHRHHLQSMSRDHRPVTPTTPPQQQPEIVQCSPSHNNPIHQARPPTLNRLLLYLIIHPHKYRTIATESSQAAAHRERAKTPHH